MSGTITKAKPYTTIIHLSGELSLGVPLAYYQSFFNELSFFLILAKDETACYTLVVSSSNLD